MCRVRVAVVSLLVLVGLVLYACASGNMARLSRPPAPSAQAVSEQTLAQLAALPTPAGADAHTFAMLKAQLRAMLIARGAGKSSSTAPATNRSKVTDLGVLPDAGGARFYWTYRNEGDYNQDSVVNISDLVRLGVHFGKSTASADWTAARVADGNQDGQISLADLTSIGMCYNNSVTQYVLEYSAELSPAAYWTAEGETPFSNSSITAEGLRRFNYLRVPAASGYYRVVPYDTSLAGITSDPAPWSSDKPGDWSMFGHDQRHTHSSPYTGPAGNALKWSYVTEDAIICSSPAICADGTVYIGDISKKIYAINVDGGLKWSYSMSGACSSPAIGADGTVYVGNSDKKLYALDPDGNLKWAYTTGDAVDSSPAIRSDGTVYVGSNDNKLYAFNPDSSLKWSYTTGDAVESSPAIGSDGTVYVGSWDGNLYAINPDGSLQWSFPTGQSTTCAPAIDENGIVYIGNHDGQIYAISPDGSMKWVFNTSTNSATSAAIGTDGTIYVGSLDHNLYAIQPDGVLKWIFPTFDAN